MPQLLTYIKRLRLLVPQLLPEEMVKKYVPAVLVPKQARSVGNIVVLVLKEEFEVGQPA
jgi:hypothetical protein